MSSGYEYQSDFAKRYVAQGRAEGEAKALLHILAARKLTPSEVERERIVGCTDLPTLERWIERAVTAGTVEAIFAE